MNEAKFWENLKSGRFASMVKESTRGKQLSHSKEVFNIMKPLFADADVESFYCLYLDQKNRIITIEKMFAGSIGSSVVYAREIIKRILELRSSNVIFVHNHPSGDPL